MVKHVVRRSHAGAVNQPRVRRPLTWRLSVGTEDCAEKWGIGGIVLWIRLALFYVLLLRASELFADHESAMHEFYCFKGEDVAFHIEYLPLERGALKEVERVEMRFRGSKRGPKKERSGVGKNKRGGV